MSTSALDFEFANLFGELESRKPAARSRALLIPRGLVYDFAWLGVLAHRMELEGVRAHFALCENLPQCSAREESRDTPDPCTRCVGRTAEFLEAAGFPYERLQAWLEPADRDQARELVGSFDPAALDRVVFDGLPLGHLQEPAICRYLHRGSLDSSERTRKIASDFVYSGALLVRGFGRIFDHVRPQVVVVANGRTSWGSVAYALAERRGIRVVTFANIDASGGSGEGQCWSFSREAPALDFPLRQAWERWSEIPLTPREDVFLDEYLQSRTRGSRYHPNPTESRRGVEAELGRELRGPIVAMCTNINWDLMVLQKHTVFDSMFDWVVETLRAARGQPYTLIVRPHPAESGIDGVESREKVLEEIEQRLPSVPDNVVLVRPDSDISTYTLLEASRAALVYTTTVGLENVLRGRPTLTCSIPHYSGRGFTLDVRSRDEYFARLRDVDSIPFPSAQEVERARRYAYLFFFRQWIPLHVYGVNGLWDVTHYRIERPEELLPGRNPHLDGIMEGIFGEGDFTVPREHAFFGMRRPDRLHDASPFAREARALLRAEALQRSLGGSAPPALVAELGALRAELAPAREAGPGDLEGLEAELRQAREQRRAGLFDAALAAYERVLCRDPDQPDALVGMARLYLDFRKPRVAEPLLRRACRAHPEHGDAWLWWVNARKCQHDVNGAAAVIEAWLRARPGAPEALEQAAALMSAHGAREDTRAVMEQLTRSGGRCGAARRWLREDCGGARGSVVPPASRPSEGRAAPAVRETGS